MDEHPVLKALRSGQPIVGPYGQNSREFVAAHGRAFNPVALPKGIRRRKPGDCFDACASFVLHRPDDGFLYTEGFAMHPHHIGTIVAHAWLSRDDEALDLTWRGPTGGLYFGVAFSAKSVARVLLKRGYHGMLDPVDDLVTATLKEAA